jgi:hypothetical protein
MAGRPYNREETRVKQEELMRWLSLPPKLRRFRTRRELAKALDISVDSTYVWEQSAGWEERRQRLAMRLMLELTPEFMQALAVQLLEGNDKAHQVYWRYMFPVLDKMKGAGSLDDPQTEGEAGMMTPAQLQRVFCDLPSEYRAMVAELWSGSGKLLPPGSCDDEEGYSEGAAAHKFRVAKRFEEGETNSCDAYGDDGEAIEAEAAQRGKRPGLEDIGH